MKGLYLFLDDFSFFSATLQEDCIYELKKRMYKIYAEKTLVQILHEFHVAAKTFDQKQQRRNYFLSKGMKQKNPIYR